MTSYALRRQGRLQSCGLAHLFFSLSFFQRHGESISYGHGCAGARTISVSKEKRRDVEFISMVPITAAEERANDVYAKGCMCL